MNKELRNLIFILAVALFFSGIIPLALASTNISPGNPHHWAWNDNIGWIDFYVTNNVNVYGDRLEGYATSSVGYIALNCNSTPNGNICGSYTFKVSNDGNGNLTGWAWNDAIGWISFDSATPGSPYAYQVTINTSNGSFSGWAWNDIIGWISFNCNNSGIGDTCGVSNYDVKTDWRNQSASADLTSSVFDTGVSAGVTLNSIMWQGNKPSGTNVKFQIASSNCSNGATNPPTCSTGSWSYLGPDGSGSTYYTPSDANVPVPINLAQHNNKRYFRYRIFMESDAGQSASPRVDDVIINWSP